MKNRPGENRRASRGTALMAVIIMFVLVSAAVVSLTLVFATQTRRTRNTAAGAQLRQLLLASAETAKDELQTHGSQPRDVAVPTPVAGSTLNMQMKEGRDGHAEVRAQARLGDHTAVQVMTFARGAKGWVLESAVLSGMQ